MEILSNKKDDATMLISTPLIAEIEPHLDYIIFIKEGNVVLQGNREEICAREGKTIDALFREVFRWV